jgi:hypothetical protein
MSRNRSSTVVKAWIFGAVLLLTAASAGAQQPARVDQETIRARQRIALIEGMLERAVQNGVDNFSRQIQALVPNADGMAMLMGAPQVRGFPLKQPGPSGVFFDVLMPSLQLSMVWPLRYSQGTDPAALATLNDLRSQLERVPDSQTRIDLLQRVRQLEQQLAPPQGSRRRGPATTVANVQAATTDVAFAASDVARRHGDHRRSGRSVAPRGPQHPHRRHDRKHRSRDRS